MSAAKKWYIGVYGGEAQARTCSPHPHEVIRDSEGDTFVLSRDYMAREAELKNEIGEVKGEYDRAVNKVDALQQRLTAADERADVLEGLLLRTNDLLYEIQGDPGAVPSSAIDALRGEVFTALKPADGQALTTCSWQYGAFSWQTGCGQEWMLNEGTPEQNGMHFCHSCGKTLVVEGEGDE